MKKTILALLVSLSLAFAGCVTTSVSQQKFFAKVAVQYAVIKVVDKNPTKAARIVEIAREVKALAGSDNANTVDLLVALIKSRVNFSKLDDADALLANTLIEAISMELKARVGNRVLGQEQLLIVGEIAEWLIQQATTLQPKA